MISADLRWRRSSHSGDTDCVEVADNLHAVRDSKNPGDSLTVDIGRLLDVVKAGRLDH
ncbi:hypothetical protein BLA60_26760 [Actinophytocola xinjiangensis]|uniref:DUF397 domain-containing protein n=1 Tax=Actinophytocola xinjiangensis TaxID=485602 RepID=A0A7Z1AW40_9PSEU|nr:DUF397 domain-containing protein [Actinophytocola xinjiangensis]OLF07528.1 hypothetical protein BLA60_26760 [Actinophytocola xinjiangensis]